MIRLHRPGRMAAVVSAMLFALLFPCTIASQTVKGWVARPANAAVYGSIRAELEAFAAELRLASLPESLLVSRLEEGAKKKVPAITLSAVLRRDTTRLLVIATTFRERGLLTLRGVDRATIVERTDKLVRAGLGMNELESTLDVAVGKTGKSATSAKRTVAALFVSIDADAAFALGVEGRARLASALVSSDLPESTFGAILDSLGGYFARGHTAMESVDLAVSALRDGFRTEGSRETSGRGGFSGTDSHGSGGGSGDAPGPGPGGGAGDTPGPGPGSGGNSPAPGGGPGAGRGRGNS